MLPGGVVSVSRRGMGGNTYSDYDYIFECCHFEDGFYVFFGKVFDREMKLAIIAEDSLIDFRSWEGRDIIS